MISPDFNTFCQLATQGNLVPVYREIMADMDTPVTAFRKIDDGRHSFLLESIEGGEKWARYSFLGASPLSDCTAPKDGRWSCCVETAANSWRFDDPTTVVRDILAGYQPVEVARIAPFCGVVRSATWGMIWCGISNSCPRSALTVSAPGTRSS